MELWHKWSKWKDIGRGDVSRGKGTERERSVGMFLYQEKECVECGVKKIRRTSAEIY